MGRKHRSTVWFHELDRTAVARVGGKNASLGEMIRHLKRGGISVPDGFATTADAYRGFLETNGLKDAISRDLAAHRAGDATLQETGRKIRRRIARASLPADFAKDIESAYQELSRAAKVPNVAVAVRSSATAEDLPEASFAGQQETYLNVVGRGALLDACRKCIASLFTDRAIAYRDAHGFDHMSVALSVGVQRMVRSDKGSAGVMFSIDTETGYPDVVLINAAYGLGENVVKGTVDPDEYMVFKPLLGKRGTVPIVEKTVGGKARKMVYGDGKGQRTRNVATSRAEREAFVLDDDNILQLARWAVLIERHYGGPMDIEWAKDGETGELFIVQARPETVQSRREASSLKSYRLASKGRLLLKGHSVGEAIAAGHVCVIRDPSEIRRFPDNAILVAPTTDPDWVPIMKRAAAIITDHGGRTSHAAIVSRELGLPAVVGAGNATRVLRQDQGATVSCAEGEEGYVYDGIASIEINELPLAQIPDTRTDVMLNLANPAAALRWWRLPSAGVGLARMEFIVGNMIKVHPLALTRFDQLKDRAVAKEISAMTRGYDSKAEYFVDRLARGIAQIAAAQFPRPVIVRMSDFKTNEYANLLGGAQFEPREENPMIGFRGASRYYSDLYRDGFDLECQALRRARDRMGFRNVIVMIPFCRTVKEADAVLRAMGENGLRRGRAGLEVYVMCEVPSNVILADQFSQRFDGFSIGSNDLTQLVLGVDRDSELLADLFDESDDAVTAMIRAVIDTAHKHGRKVGLCGQAPSDRPEFARFLVDAGIDSISVTPDSYAAVKRHVAEAEKRLKRRMPSAA